MIYLRQTSMYVLVALALLLPATAQAGPERTQQAAVVEWTAPTPGGSSVLAVPADSQLTILLGAQAAGGSAVRVQIRATQMPGGTFTAQDGNPAGAKYTWTPATARVGDHRVTFTAVASGLPVGAAEPRTMTIRVTKAGTPPPPPPPGHPPQKRIWPKTTVLSDYKAESYKWAFVTRRTVVRRGPPRATISLQARLELEQFVTAFLRPDLIHSQISLAK